MAEEVHRLTGLGEYARKRGPASALFEVADAVITTPSSVQLEAALHGVPVAVLDYHNSPQFTPMAWTISAPQHIGPVVSELLSPPPGKLFVQNALLDDALWRQSPAVDRMVQLITTMIRIGQECRAQDRPLEFPARILPVGRFAPEADGSNLASLFPDNADFRNQDVERLQLELSQARKALGEYPDRFFEQRSANQHLRSYINWLRLLVRNRAESLNEMSEALNRLKAERGNQSVGQRE
jgi:hypothetical protein